MLTSSLVPKNWSPVGAAHAVRAHAVGRIVVHRSIVIFLLAARQGGDHDHKRDERQAFLFHRSPLVVAAIHAARCTGTDSGPGFRPGGSFNRRISISIGKGVANRTSMLVVMEETSGLPFECPS